jgi:NAD(P)H-hydrate epimerase
MGTGLAGPVREPMFSVMKEIVSWQKQIIAIDIPSGLDANTGEILGIALPAILTITFALPKKGFLVGKGPEITGQVVVVEISIPRDLLEKK